MVIRILVFCFLFICYGFQCHKCEKEFNRRYNLVLNYADLKKSLSVGETFYIPIDFSAIMNCENNEVYDNRNGTFSVRIQLLRVQDNNQDITDGLVYFEVGDSIAQFYPSTGFDRNIGGSVNLNCGPVDCNGIIPVKCLVTGYYAIQLVNGYFGNISDCEYNHLGTTFMGDDNNFSICSEIKTTSFRLNQGGISISYYAHPASTPSLYFFKVVE